MKIYHLEQEALFSSIKHGRVKERTKNKGQTKCKTHFKSHAFFIAVFFIAIWEHACIFF